MTPAEVYDLTPAQYFAFGRWMDTERRAIEKARKRRGKRR